MVLWLSQLLLYACCSQVLSASGESTVQDCVVQGLQCCCSEFGVESALAG